MAALFSLQGSSYIVSFLTLPYLIRVLGPEKFGLYAFGLAFTQYLMAISDYGFNLTAARRISLAKDNLAEVSRIYSNVMAIKLVFMGISFLILMVVIGFVPYFASERQFYLVFFLAVVGHVLFPVWLYQGLEKMKYISYLNISVKLVVALAIFQLVKQPDDYVIAAVLQSMIYLGAGVASLVLNRKLLRIRFMPQLNWQEAKGYLIEGGHLFVSSISYYIYTLGAQLTTGLLNGYVAAGYLASIQKISAAVVAGVCQPIAQALYPQLCKLYQEDKAAFFRLRKRVLIIGFFSCCLVSLIFVVYSQLIITLVTGSAEQELVRLMRILAIGLFFMMNNALLHVFVVAMQRQRQLQNMYMVAAGIFLAGCLPMIFLLGNMGAAAVLVFIEVYINIQSLRQTREESGQALLPVKRKRPLL